MFSKPALLRLLLLLSTAADLATGLPGRGPGDILILPILDDARPSDSDARMVAHLETRQTDGVGTGEGFSTDSNTALPDPEAEQSTSQGSGTGPSETRALVEDAIKQGKQYLSLQYNTRYNELVVPAKPVTLSDTPGKCKQLGNGLVAACNQVVKTEAATCKQGSSEAMKKCMNDEIKKCQKDWLASTAGWKCQGANLITQGKCKGPQVEKNVGCGLDRAGGKGCCEVSRSVADGLCSNGMSPQSLTGTIQQFQQGCKITAKLTGVALQAYVTGEAVGFISHISAVKELGEGLKALQEVQTSVAQYKRWGDAAAAAQAGRYDEAAGKVADLPGISVAPSDPGWADAVKAHSRLGVEDSPEEPLNPRSEMC